MLILRSVGGAAGGEAGSVITTSFSAAYRIGDLVHLSGETSNQLFEVLADWNAQLTSCSLYENPEELPFQLDGAASQKTADSANSDGEEPVETYGSGSWTG